MKKKSIIAILMTLIMCFTLSACNNTTQNEDTTDNTKVEDSNTAMLESAKDSEVIDSWYYTHGNEFPLQYFVEDMKFKGLAETNEFANQACGIFDKLEISTKGDFAKDCLHFYRLATCEMNMDIDFGNIVKAYAAGYDANDNGKNKEALFPPARIIAVKTNADSQEIYVYKVEQGRLGEQVWHDHTIEKMVYEEGILSLKEIPTDKVSSNISDNEELLLLLASAYDESIKTGIEEAGYETVIVEDSSPIDPAVGMTAEEVEDSTWGYPNKKNIDEYEWGTEEQWVYEDRGYIYFEDGKVTSIQYR